jgi:hypothetical protein
MLKTNVGVIDRVSRIIVGAALIAAYFLFPAVGYGWILIVVGVIALGTGLMSTCPIYSILGLSTNAPREP